MKILKHFNPSDQHFIKHLPGDKERENFRRQVFEACYSFVQPKTTSHGHLISYMTEVAELLGISEEEMNSDEMVALLTGNKVLDASKPYSMCYGGHQFGNWAGQLGDGRAINLFELEHVDKRWTLQLKGAGETPYSRGADGLAVLRSSIREYLCSEAMHHLGVPTTRALSLSLSGDSVLRDMLYDGNPAMEKGAIVCRVAPSFIRFGNFEIFAARKDHVNLKKLLDYTIDYHFQELAHVPAGTGQNGTTIMDSERYLTFFKTVADRTLEMIVHWQRVGFVHGVMNTDNMSILGLTIDYGPYGWLEDYNLDWTPNTTDASTKRYRFGYQPSMALWNLVRLANAIYPLFDSSDGLEAILSTFQERYKKAYFEMMASKIGLEENHEGDEFLIAELEKNLLAEETDMTIFFRLLAEVNQDLSEDQAFEKIQFAFYEPSSITDELSTRWLHWFGKYASRLSKETQSNGERVIKMNRTNPKYVLRNYMNQLAIDLAEKGDYSLIKEFEEMLKHPYDEQTEYQKWFAKRPDWARTKVGCSMLSCSS